MVFLFVFISSFSLMYCAPSFSFLSFFLVHEPEGKKIRTKKTGSSCTHKHKHGDRLLRKGMEETRKDWCMRRSFLYFDIWREMRRRKKRAKKQGVWEQRGQNCTVWWEVSSALPFFYLDRERGIARNHEALSYSDQGWKKKKRKGVVEIHQVKRDIILLLNAQYWVCIHSMSISPAT